MNLPWKQQPGVALKILCGLAFILCPKVFAEPVFTVRDNGDPANRVDVVVLGDGYTASEMNKFADDVEAFIAGMFEEEPLKEYRWFFNVHRIDVVSNESGADHPDSDPPIEKDTALDAAYNCLEVGRLLCPDTGKVLNVLTRSLNANQRDVIVLLVNDSRYGGAGGPMAVTSVNPQMVEIVLHELGHSFAHLADEYFFDEEGCRAHIENLGLKPDIEPEQPNVTRESNRASIKWNHWIDGETKIPTRTDHPGVPGLYEGARYCPKGIFRPTFASKMRQGGEPFEQINSEQIVKEIYNFVSPLDHTFPENSFLSLESGHTQTFYVSTPVPASHELKINWLVDGELQGKGLQYTLDSGRLDRSRHTVEAVVEDRTPLVRSDPDNVLMDRRTWNVTTRSATGRPDLVIDSLTASARAIVGRQASISAILRNNGSVDARPFRFQAYLTRDFSRFLNLAECSFGSGLQAGQSSSCSSPVWLPDSLAPGVYYAGAFVDSHLQVDESNELNNKRLSDSGLFTVELAERTYYFPHLAVGAGWQTTISYINHSMEEVTCETEFLSDDGYPLTVSFAGLGTVESRLDVLPPGGAVRQESNVGRSASLAPGWARATCSHPVKASLLFRRRNTEGMPVAEAAVNATTVPGTRFVTFAEQGEGQFGTGVAYANPSDTEVRVTFAAKDAGGQTLASVTRHLPPGGHGSQNMVDLFDLASFSGSLEVSSTQPIVSLSLNFEADPVFSSLPPGALDTFLEGSATFYFPHLAVGAGWQTTISYINYSKEEVTCETEFLSDDGSPLTVSFAGLGRVVGRTDVLPPGGAVRQESNVGRSAPLAPGWARATCSHPVKASLLFRRRNTEGMPVAEAAVNATTVPGTRFVTFAEQGEGQFGTGVAYANPSDTEVRVTFAAKDAGGQTLASVTRHLPPGGHGSQNMVDLFDLASFSGSLEVSSTQPIVSLSLNFEADPVFSSLPPGDTVFP